MSIQGGREEGEMQANTPYSNPARNKLCMFNATQEGVGSAILPAR